MAGKQIYFTEKELEMIRHAFASENYSFEGDYSDEEIEENYLLAVSIRNKARRY
ncbi:hypothetical protein [Paenibacillus donghaensis]|uniref:hypothetical protein n=1 Tax=Paenibacillus donghaensis TaxID=414771 RepID=UPI0012FD4313|nr:hypothetical protein [Paenibacillus donghaensis]